MTLGNIIGLAFINTYGWRLFSIVISVPALVPAVFLLILPESPKFLSVKNEHRAVVDALR